MALPDMCYHETPEPTCAHCYEMLQTIRSTAVEPFVRAIIDAMLERMSLASDEILSAEILEV